MATGTRYIRLDDDDGDDSRFVLDQHAQLDLYSGNSLKQQYVDRHVALKQQNADRHVALKQQYADRHVALKQQSMDRHVALKQQNADRHVALLGHIILIASYLVFVLTPQSCILSGREAANTNCIV